MPLTAIKNFVKFEGAGGICLMIAAAAALILDNSALAPFYDSVLQTPVVVKIGAFDITKPLLLWINDGLMAIFFFLVGLEIKREFVEGELSSVRQASLPLIGAIGGMAIPAAIYAYINWGDPTRLNGWAIPAATDIAFALAILTLIGSRVPLALKVMLTAIAIIDDLGAIVIIAAFYTANLSISSLVYAAIAIVALTVLNRLGVKKTTPYILIGITLWAAVLKSGVHATLAGVILAFAIPMKGQTPEAPSPLKKLEHAMHPWVAFLVLPAFGFANAGVSFAGMNLSSLLEPVTLGIMLGLFVGKQIGIFGFVRVAVALGLTAKPPGVTWLQVYGVSLLCGIGFTMSLFIGGLAFEDPEYAARIRLGVLAGSLASGLLGFLILRYGPVATPVPDEVAVPTGQRAQAANK